MQNRYAVHFEYWPQSRPLIYPALAALFVGAVILRNSWAIVVVVPPLFLLVVLAFIREARRDARD